MRNYATEQEFVIMRGGILDKSFLPSVFFYNNLSKSFKIIFVIAQFFQFKTV